MVGDVDICDITVGDVSELPIVRLWEPLAEVQNARLVGEELIVPA